MIHLLAKGCMAKLAGFRTLPAQSSRMGCFSPVPNHLASARLNADSRVGIAAGPGIAGLTFARRLGHRFLCAARSDDSISSANDADGSDSSSPATPTLLAESQQGPRGSLIERLVVGFPTLLGKLQAIGALDMTEAAEAPSKLEVSDLTFRV